MWSCHRGPTRLCRTRIKGEKHTKLRPMLLYALNPAVEGVFRYSWDDIKASYREAWSIFHLLHDVPSTVSAYHKASV